METFNSNGSYNKTDWKNGDTITADKLNKIEDALYEINAADADFVTTMDLNNALVYKANANHSHSEYVEKNNLPFIPTKVSQLTNDAGYITEIPDEYITEIPAEYITETELLAKNYANESFVISKINDAKLSGGGDNPSIDLSAYALKDDLADYVTNVTLDSKNYADKNYVNTAIENAQFDSDNIDLSDYALKSEIPTVPTNVSAFNNDAGYVTEAMVDTKIDNAQIDIDLSDYALKNEIPTKVSAFTNDAGYTTEQYVNDEITAARTTINTLYSRKDHTHEDYALKTEIPTDHVTSNSIIRIELVTEYPETEEDGVLYIKVREQL